MDAIPLLEEIARGLRLARLEAILIGNAGAALLGAPVTTVDFDFLIRETPLNRAKLKKLAALLDAMLLRPFYPTSKLFRLMNDDRGLQIDFMVTAHGIKSFASLRSRAEIKNIGKESITVASIDDIINSKRKAGRDRDKAVLNVLEKTKERSQKKR